MKRFNALGFVALTGLIAAACGDDHGTTPETDAIQPTDTTSLPHDGSDGPGSAAIWTSLAVAEKHSCGVTTEGALYCWGSNEFGQLGDDTLGHRLSPTREATGASDWESVSAGDRHTCGVKADGSLYCWGRRTEGQLGTGGAGYDPPRRTPERVTGGAEGWVSVAAGGSHTCGVKTDGSLYCWGSNGGGRLGDGTTGERRTPTREASRADDWASVSAGDEHTCAVKTDGSLHCWGRNAAGQLGDGTTADRRTPTQETSGASDWASVAAGWRHTCGVKTDGSLHCWGRNTADQLGDGTTVDRRAPTREASGAAHWASVSAGWRHSCGVKTDGSLHCWGRNVSGKLGDGTTTNRATPSPETSGATDWVWVGAGERHTCGLKEDGSIHCWGWNSDGQLGDGTTTDHRTPTREASGATDWRAAAAGGEHSCGVKVDGSLLCWGRNHAGQLGDATTTTRRTPTDEASGASDWVTVATGERHTCGVKIDGSLLCWGSNYYRQVGAPTSTSPSEPTQEASGATNWATVSAGEAHTCGVTADGAVLCWGRNWIGELGIGTASSALHFMPTPLANGASDWREVSTGDRHTCGVTTDGALYCWGRNVDRQLGDGTATERLTPTQEASGASDWLSVSAGGVHTCGLKTEGSIFCWGDNGHGQLADETAIQRARPSQESSQANDWASVSAGSAHTCGTKTDGSLYCWGMNEHGQLGDGTTIERPTPTREASDATDWTSVSAGTDHTCGVKTDGSLHCWGRNLHGQLGDGADAIRATPGPIAAAQ